MIVIFEDVVSSTLKHTLLFQSGFIHTKDVCGFICPSFNFRDFQSSSLQKLSIYIPEDCLFIIANSVDLNEMLPLQRQHLIWVFSICQNTCLLRYPE